MMFVILAVEVGVVEPEVGMEDDEVLLDPWR